MGVCIGEEEEARRERFGSKTRREIPPRSKLSASAAVPRRAMRPPPPNETVVHVPSVLDLISEAGNDLGRGSDVVAELLACVISRDAVGLDGNDVVDVHLGVVDAARVAVGAVPRCEHDLHGLVLVVEGDGGAGVQGGHGSAGGRGCEGGPR